MKYAKAQFCPTKEQKTWQHYAKEVTDIGKHESARQIRELPKPLEKNGCS